MRLRTLVTAALMSLITAAAFANVAPVIDSFTASPAVAAPGQAVTITIAAHDPDCATSCTSGCGLYIAPQYLTWSDNTSRGVAAFTSSNPGVAGSPWTASITWIAPAVEGTYTITASVPDSGGMLCGGRKTTVATLDVSVTNAQPPVIDSITVTPQSVAVGGTADVSVAAHDPAGRTLTYTFTADAGTMTQTSPSSSTARWTAPQIAGNVTLRVKVTAGGTSVDGQTTANVQIGSYARTLTVADFRPTRVAALQDGRIAAVDGASGLLQMMTSTGVVVWRQSGLRTPVGIANAADELFVVERAANRVSVWSSSGAHLRDLPIAAALPNGIAAGPNAGEIALTDTAGAVVQIVSATDGHALRTIGSGTLAAPIGIACANGRVAVADGTGGRVLLFDSTGALIRAIGDDTLLVRPEGVAWDSANARLIISDSFSGELTILGEDGVVRGVLGGFGTGAGQLVNPIDVALLPGSLVAAPTAGGTIPLFQLLQSMSSIAAPSNVVAADRANDDGGAIALTWSASADDPARVTAYLVQRSTAETANFATIARVAAGTKSYVDVSSVDGTCYHYQVAALDGVTTTPSTQTPCVASRNDLAPPAPASVVASAVSPQSVSATWSAVSASDLAGYVLDAGATSLRVDKSTTTATLTGLTAATQYTISVRAIDTAANRSTAATANVQTYADAAPAAPVSVAVTDARTGAAVDVTWTQPASSVPVSSYTLVFTPSTTGWPVATATSSTTTAHVTGLVNQLAYALTITASTPWNRASDSSSAAAAMATRAAQPLPIVAETTSSDGAGISAVVDPLSQTRELRFQYRTTGGAKLQLIVDGRDSGAVFADTVGAWADASFTLDKEQLTGTQHTIELRNGSFPDPLAQLGLRRIDLVPLAPSSLTATGYNTVVDLSWQLIEPRADLAASVLRTKNGVTTTVPCASATSKCRDTFLTNGESCSYSVAIVSPAGWSGGAANAIASPMYADGPPPVTDVQITSVAGGMRVDWTPLSTTLTATSAPVAVPLYRVYRRDAAGLTLLLETSAPPANVAGVAADAIVVHSVDAQGRESQ